MPELQLVLPPSRSPSLPLSLPPAASEQIMAARARKTIIYQVSRRRPPACCTGSALGPPPSPPPPLLLSFDTSCSVLPPRLFCARGGWTHGEGRRAKEGEGGLSAKCWRYETPTVTFSNSSSEYDDAPAVGAGHRVYIVNQRRQYP